MSHIQRSLSPAILSSLQDSPVVFIQGARQTGKSTLAQSLAELGHKARYLTLDDAATLAAAQSDPQGFIDGLHGNVVLDEVQRVPGLPLAIKAAVDRKRTPGRFLLTGSANILLFPKLAESLAGRIEIHTLWPLSQGEYGSTRETFLDSVFHEQFHAGNIPLSPWEQIAARILQGGYPEMLRRTEARRRSAWFDSYISALLQRDVRDISNVRDLADLPRLLSLLASRATGLLDFADISRSLEISQTTIKRHVGLLQATFLIQMLPAWFTNLGKRLAKAPKLLLNDSGLLLHLLGADAVRMAGNSQIVGMALENFVVNELFKQRGWSDIRPGIFHYRTHGGDEVDIVLEDAAGRIVGIEVKATASVTARHFKGLQALNEVAGSRFQRGLVLYTGHAAVPFARNMHALPIAALWSPRKELLASTDAT